MKLKQHSCQFNLPKGSHCQPDGDTSSKLLSCVESRQEDLDQWGEAGL
jgi:hypothetical protein